jgi:hypothetical protein
MNKYNGFSKLLKEPLYHFLLIGAGLFFLFSQVNSDESLETKEEIFIQKFKLVDIRTTFKEKNEREATKEEVKKLLEELIKEEVLYREALNMGLHKDDKVIRHRLAEKMKYQFEDISMFDESKEDEDFYDSLKSRYKITMDDEIINEAF